MNWLVSTSLHLRIIVVALAVVLMIVGLRVVRDTPLDVFPEFAPPLVEIQTEAPGLSTAEVESLISAPIENALNGVAELKTLRSKSVLGLSSVVLIFQEGADLMRARQLVQERLALVAPQLPAASRAPVILQPLSSTSRALKIGVSSKTLSQMELSTLARWTIRPRLMAIPGVANVAIWGQRDRQLQVLVDPDRLRNHDVTLDDVVRATRDAVAVDAGGFVDTPNQRLAVAHLAAVTQPQDLARIPVVFRNGAPLELGAVAEVVEGFPPPIGDAVINDGPGLLLIVEKQPTGNTLDVTREVEAALDALKPGLKDVEIDSTIFRPATFIEVALKNLRNALLIGCLLVIAVLVAFLFEWRTALISLSAIPLSLLAAALVLYWRGDTINTMVIAGLVIALGEVVDDAIIDVENIMRRLRLNREAGNPESAFSVVLKASLEVRSAIVYATLIVVLVFLPIFFLDGLSGSFFRPLAVSYVLAVLASLGVALTLTPALSLLLLPRAANRERAEAPLTRWLKRGYRRALPAFINKPRMAVATMLVLFALTAVAVPLMGEEFLPNFKETDFLMHWVEKPGTSLEAMQRITVRVSRELRAIPGVRNFGSHIGRAEVADEVVGPNFTELWISIDPNVALRADSGEDSGGGGRLPGTGARPADLSERTHQGSSDRRRRINRRARLRPRSGRAARQGRRSQQDNRRRAGRGQSEGGTTGPGPADRSAIEDRRGVTLRPDARRCSPRGDHAHQRPEGRRALRGAADQRRGRVGRGGHPRRPRIITPVAHQPACGRRRAARRRGRHTDRAGAECDPTRRRIAPH